MKNEFQDNYFVKDTLRESSKDDNGNYLLDFGEEIVYLLDEIAPIVGKELAKGKQQKSVDAVVRNEQGEVYFIEFKNTLHSRMPKNELFYKTPDSVFTYLYVFEPDISIKEFREKCTYVVVFNDNAPCKQRESESQSFEMFKNKVREQAKVEENIDKVLWGLDSLVGKLFKKVYTVDKEVFVNQIKPLIWREN